VSFHSFSFISIWKALYLCVEGRPSQTKARRLIDVARFYILMSPCADDKDKLYLSEFLFVSFRSYLKTIVFMCRKKAKLDESPAFPGCGAVHGLMTMIDCISVSFCSFPFVSISKLLYLCVEKRPS